MTDLDSEEAKLLATLSDFCKQDCWSDALESCLKYLEKFPNSKLARVALSKLFYSRGLVWFAAREIRELSSAAGAVRIDIRGQTTSEEPTGIDARTALFSLLRALDPSATLESVKSLESNESSPVLSGNPGNKVGATVVSTQEFSMDSLSELDSAKR